MATFPVSPGHLAAFIPWAAVLCEVGRVASRSCRAGWMAFSKVGLEFSGIEWYFGIGFLLV